MIWDGIVDTGWVVRGEITIVGWLTSPTFPDHKAYVLIEPPRRNERFTWGLWHPKLLVNGQRFRWTITKTIDKVEFID